jgi:hypothetical protein
MKDSIEDRLRQAPLTGPGRLDARIEALIAEPTRRDRRGYRWLGVALAAAVVLLVALAWQAPPAGAPVREVRQMVVYHDVTGSGRQNRFLVEPAGEPAEPAPLYVIRGNVL